MAATPGRHPVTGEWVEDLHDAGYKEGYAEAIHDARGLATLLGELPEQDEDGWYFELRKQAPYWVCAKTNYLTNKEACNNIGDTPEEAVLKMLQRIEERRT